MKVWLVCALTLLFTACGGGGGGSSSGSSGSSASTGVRVIHASIDTSPVDVISTGTNSVVHTARFGEGTFYGALSTGVQSLTLSVSGRPSRTIENFSVDVQTSERRSILLFGGNDSVPLQASLVLDTAGEIPEGQGALRVANGMFGASALDVVIDSTTVTQVSYGTVSAYVPAAIGPHAVELKRASDGRRVYSGTVVINSGDTFTLAAAGEIDYFTNVNLLED